MKRRRDQAITSSSGSLFSIALTHEESDDPLPMNSSSTATGLIFESSPTHYDRYNRYHQERPLRIESLQEYLLNHSSFNFSERCTLLKLNSDDESDLSDTNISFHLHETDLLRVHTQSFLNRLKALELHCSRTGSETRSCEDRLDHEQSQYHSIFMTASSYSCAKQASSALCLVVSYVLLSRLRNGFVLARPPGHHSEPSFTCGYCILNHIAIAASYALEHFSNRVKKILIVDWDVHHGNGTQRAFIDKGNILYFSVHRYHGGNFFPFTTKRCGDGTNNSLVNLSSGSSQVVGIGEGQGFNINVGWEAKGMGDLEYLAVWHHLLLPFAKEYQPDLILVSAGFDSAEGDMGECNVTPQCFGELTRQLLNIAHGKVICSLEGGYVRSVLQKCVEQVLCALIEPVNTNGEISDMDNVIVGSLQSSLEAIDSSAAKSLCKTIKAHQPYWKCLQKYILPSDNVSTLCSKCAY